MTVWSDEGHLYYKSQINDLTVCGIYIIAKPEQTVHVYFDYVDVPCNTGGLIAVSAVQRVRLKKNVRNFVSRRGNSSQRAT